MSPRGVQAQWEAAIRAVGQTFLDGSPGGPPLFPQGLQTLGHTPVTQPLAIISLGDSSRRSEPEPSARSDGESDDSFEKD